MSETADILIIGAGAAGLMSAIAAGRTARAAQRPLRIIAVDGARTLGAKILVAGGGRCNVTHHEVTEAAYAGSSRNAIKNVLRAFDVARTTAFFAELGVQLKREETGKLFPVTDSARTVLNALLAEVAAVDAEIRYPWRAATVTRGEGGFTVVCTLGQSITARRLILTPGGMALPKSGSDGHGYTLSRSLGHTTTGRIFPALVPLTLAEGFFLRDLSGLTLNATLMVLAPSGKRLIEFTNSTLFTHVGLSGPSVLDISRYYLDAHAADSGVRLAMNVLPGFTLESADEFLRTTRVSPARALTEAPHRLPDRLARALCTFAGVDPSSPPTHLKREARRDLAAALTQLPLPITGDRGFTHAEVTAGGVPLAELHLQSMESRITPGLHLAGEICDVDGRIGGFNFQWAWASGFLAGTASARGCL